MKKLEFVRGIKMAKKELYDTALREVKELAADVIEQCSDFANRIDKG